ncbi:MAG: NAD(P)-dependent oxidoreductase [Pyrinomonadaceae bacterium]
MSSDIITLHCPLTAQTRHLIGPDELARMPRHALLINCARGGVVDEAALLEALRAGASPARAWMCSQASRPGAATCCQKLIR